VLITQFFFSSRALLHSLRSLFKAQLILPAMDRLNGFLRRDSAKEAFDVTVESVPENSTPRLRQWKPVTLRRPFLSAVILVTLGLLALVQILVIYDQRHGGILFAIKISQLGAGHIFLYRYFPTIISVSYGLIWHWIDIDARRVEPYRQLSKPGGASGSCSLHLQYPTDLLAFVPLKALKRRHWPVVIASSALVLVGMGLTPLQAAIFATEKVTRIFDEPMLLSKSHMSMADQALQITANYTYSVANIVWLDERLPPFMTRDAAFTPFKLETPRTPHADETWTAETTSYSVDVTCEPAILGSEEKWSSSQGCRLPDTFGPPDMDIVGNSIVGDVIKEYTPFFAGSSGNGGNVNWYLSPYCPKEAINVFFVVLRKNRNSKDDPPANMTRLFCETVYHQQNVSATIRRSDGGVLEVAETAPRTLLAPGIFNTSVFQEQISNARQILGVRGALPSSEWPDQRPQLSKLPVTISGSTREMSNIFGLAVGAYPKDIEDYMDPQVLTTALGAAHRLLFARAMVDVLATSYEETETFNGKKIYVTEAVRILPKFAYAVEAVLGVVILMAATLIAVTWCDAINLHTDPDSLSALMLLVNGQTGLLDQFSPHDQSSWALLKAETSGSTYELEQPYDTHGGTLKLQTSPALNGRSKKPQVGKDEPDFAYPIEFSMVTGSIFVLALLVVLAGISYLYQANQNQGLALPTQNRFVRQLLENYIPTVIATLIEPVWVVLNRLLCLFQPFEQLHAREVSAPRSIDLKYSSLPPQLVLLKALSAKHFILSAVCTMALLANVLAVAFSGLLDEDTLSVARRSSAFPTYDVRLKQHISNGTETGNPFPFYYAMANFTSGTPMPVWTSDTAFYLPASHEARLNQSDRLELNNVPSLAASLDCNPIDQARSSSWSLGRGSFADSPNKSTNLTVSLPTDHGNTLTCATKPLAMTSSYYPWPCSSQQFMAVEFLAPLMAPRVAYSDNESVADDACQGLYVGVWARKKASDLCKDNAFAMSDDDAMAMVCKAKVVVQSANVTLSGEHYVLDAQSKQPLYDFEGSDQLIKEATQAMWLAQHTENYMMYQGGTWHNDSFPSDWHSYVMNLIEPDSGILDPTLPPPDFNLTAALFTKSYQKLFAILMGMDHERLLAEAGENSTAIDAKIVRPEVRIVVSQPMVVLSSTILGLYIIVAIIVYAHRPGKFLPRMPLTMASDIALFAASKAVAEQEETQELSAVRKRFGYGRFIGTDGRPHIGVEQAPFVVAL
jgi:hypothetical protein